MNKEIETEVKKMWEGSKSGNIDDPLDAYERINIIAQKSDLPQLIEHLESENNNFWTRELLSDPISRLGDHTCLKVLLEAISKNEQEGHDNDSLNFNILNLIDNDLENCTTTLEKLLSDPTYPNKAIAEDFLTYCRNTN